MKYLKIYNLMIIAQNVFYFFYDTANKIIYKISTETICHMILKTFALTHINNMVNQN